MSVEKAIAIVLRVVEWSETSSILTLYTREFGKIRGLAKGARRPKGPFESALDLLSTSRIVFLRKSSDALDLLTEAKLERWFRPAGRDPTRLYAGYYVAELLNELTDDYDPHPDLFDAAADALARLAEEGPTPAEVLRFELQALAAAGQLPSLSQCADCGAPAPAAGRGSFGQLAGGLLCAACRPGKRQVVSISGEALAVLRQFADIESEVWREMAVPRGVMGELRGLLNGYLSHLLGRPPRMHRYLGFLAH